MSLHGPLLTLLVASGVLDTDLLHRAAAAADRPKRCTASGGAAWISRGRRGSAEWCALAASAVGRLRSEPRASLRIAERLLSSEPNEGFLHAVRARALLRSGTPEESWQAWSQALQAGFEPRGPYFLLDFARSANLTGHNPVALRAYREVLQRSLLLSDPLTLQLSCIEGAVVAVRLGPDHLDDARALSARAAAETRARSTEPWSQVLHALLASLDPAQTQPTDAAQEGSEWLAASLTRSRATTPVLPSYELKALVSFAFESQPEHAAQLFSSFVEQHATPGYLRGWARRRAEILARRSR